MAHQSGYHGSSSLDYLTSVLSQRGPSAVPYDEAVKWNVRDHVSELQKVFPTLTVKLSEYHSNDGRLLNILKVEGTMPIHYQGNKYNIPILMWLTERYPQTAPLVYVVPTANMVIRAGPWVSPSGQVSTPLLTSWLFPSSNLVDVVLEMSQVFGNEPPLYSKPPGYTPPPQSQSVGSGAAQPPAHYPVQGRPQGASTGAGPPSSSGLGNGPSSSYSNGPGGVYGMPPPHYPMMGGNAAGGSTPYATPSPGNTPNVTPGPPAGGPGWGGAAPGNGPTGPFGGGASVGQGPPPPPPPPPPSYPGIAGMFGGLGGLFGGGGGGGGPPPVVMPPPPNAGQQPVQQQQQAGPPPPPPPPPEPVRPAVSKEELEVHFRHLAVEALSQQLRALERGFAAHVGEETHKQLELQRNLEERGAQLQAVRDTLTRERMSTEQLVGELGRKTKALQSWLERNEPKAQAFDADTTPISQHMVPLDGVMRQGMETQAKDLACEDAMLVLDKLLQSGQVPLDAYLKQTRALCRQQFFSRALGLKVAAAQSAAASSAAASARAQAASAAGPSGQGQAGPGGLPPRQGAAGPVQVPPGYTAGTHGTLPYPIAHGDAWSHGLQPLNLNNNIAMRAAEVVTGVRPQPGAALHTGMLTNPLTGSGR